jgi:hypothetical protein
MGLFTDDLAAIILILVLVRPFVRVTTWTGGSGTRIDGGTRGDGISMGGSKGGGGGVANQANASTNQVTSSSIFASPPSSIAIQDTSQAKISTDSFVPSIVPALAILPSIIASIFVVSKTT